MQNNCKCDKCGKDFYKKPSHMKKGRRNFCKVSCFRKAAKTGKNVQCNNCGKEVYRKKSELKERNTFYCSNSCSASINNSRYRLGKNNWNYKEDSPTTYRKRALDTYGEICSSTNCPFEKVDPRLLDVDHIDSDRSNNHISNLQVLCVWCHAVKTRLGQGSTP